MVTITSYASALKTALRLFRPKAHLRIDTEGTRIYMENAKAEHVDAWLRVELQDPANWQGADKFANLRAYGEFYTFIRPHFNAPDQTLGAVIAFLTAAEELDDDAREDQPAVEEESLNDWLDRLVAEGQATDLGNEWVQLH